MAKRKPVDSMTIQQKTAEMKRSLSFFILILMVMSLTVCNAPSRQLLDNGTYLTLVNASHRLPANWLDKIELVTAENALGEEFQAEKETLSAFGELQKDLLNDGIEIEADRAYSAEGDSEYATGLAIDLFLMEDGAAVRDHAVLSGKQEVFEKIHSRLADRGFVVRVLPGKEEICGMDYEPWHIRYVGTTAAREMAAKDLVLEEYLGELGG